MKYYAVRSGRKVGIFTSWDECKALVTGYKGAEYKSFTAKADAANYLNKETPNEQKPDSLSSEEAIAYVDGSYRDDTKEFSCGAVLFSGGKKLEFSEKYSDPDMVEMRNVAGEIMGSLVVIKHCLENGIAKLTIYHDYAGIAKWAEGEWKANKDGTKAYRDFCIAAAEKIKLSFVKVKGHSGDKYNEEADMLAKKVLGISK